MENKYIVEQMSEERWFYIFKDINERGEELLIELTKCINTSSPKSLPNLWAKNEYINRILENYWAIQTYVKDTEGNSFGKYNPQHKGTVINFDWMFEATEDNLEKLINKVYQLFSSAKGKTATEEKRLKIKEYALKNNIDLFITIPVGWNKLTDCVMGPVGTIWISNMESFNSRKRKQAILLES